MKRGKIFYGILRIAFSIGILFLLFRKIPLFQVYRTLTSAKGRYVLIALFLSLFVQLILALRLKLIVDKQGMNVSAQELLKINFSSAFYGLFLPGGNVARSVVSFYKISKPEEKWSEGLVSIAIDRLLAITSLCFLGIVFLLVDVPPDSKSLVTKMGTLLLLFLAVSFLMFSEKAPFSSRTLIGFMKNFLPRQKKERLSGSLNPYQSLPPSTIIFATLISLCTHLLGVLLFYVVAVSTGANISYVTIGWIRSSVILITMIPISISGLGVREGMMLYYLKPYGVTGEEAMAISFIVYGITLLLPGFIGGLVEGRNFLFAKAGWS